MGSLGTRRLGALSGALLLSGCTLLGGEDPPTQTVTATVTSTESTSPSNEAPEEEVPDASSAFPQTRTGNGQRVDTVTFLNAVVQHADQQVWVPYFANLKLAEPMVDVVYVGSAKHPTFKSSCDLTGDKVGGDIALPGSANAWYCSKDGGTQWAGALILPVTTFSSMWDGMVLNKRTTRPGDFAAATVVAHEFGHHVADELAKQLKVPEESGKNPELIADCFAGIWASAAYTDGYLEAGDLQEGVAAMVALGVNGSTTHGTSAEREKAFLLGWNARRMPYKCMESYWKSMAQQILTR